MLLVRCGAALEKCRGDRTGASDILEPVRMTDIAPIHEASGFCMAIVLSLSLPLYLSLSLPLSLCIYIYILYIRSRSEGAQGVLRYVSP
jgi:hypothetical protein